ncbi:lectin c-type domain-containing protein [Phthorimaea operculella]|nr:lectin c-type domain-containing protein [Phthorimaea operculella]
MQWFVFTNGQQNYFFREDYTYLSSTQSFYKYHNSQMTWNDAKEKCEQEGAILFYANDRNEAIQVVAFWNQKYPSYHLQGLSISLGIYCTTERNCVTVDGRSSNAVYVKWSPGEPEVIARHEPREYNCARWVVLEDIEVYFTYRCDIEVPFICKKTLEDHQRDQVNLTTSQSIRQEAEEIQFSNGSAQRNNFSRRDYTYLSSTQSFYKYHYFSTTWNEAKEKCEQEGAILFYANDRNEASEVMAFWKRENPSEHEILLGIYCKTDEDCKTVDGRSSRAVYTIWSSDEPKVKVSYESNEHNCAHWAFRDDEEYYFTYRCNMPSPFICKRAVEGYQRDQVDSKTSPSDPQEEEEIQFAKGGFMACNCYLVLFLAAVLLIKF